jgi:Fe-S-cluster containining protein
MSDDEIPCAENLRWCRAVCGALVVHLGPEDVAAGVVTPDPERPDLLAHRDGTCVHIAAGACTVYEHRPAPCRAFDCRTDRRIWRDYAQRIPNPNLDKLFLAATNVRRLRVLP